MNKNQINYFVGIILTSYFFALNSADTFEEMWQKMQKEYARLRQIENEINNFYLVQPLWANLHRQPIINHVLGAPDKNFLNGPIVGTMVATTISKESENYILKQTSPETKIKLSMFKETTFGGLKRMCPSLKCTTDSLRHLYFMARILGRKKDDIKLMVELGGGYGCLARIAKSIYPEITYIIIDLPEVLAIQSLFLPGASPEFPIKIHTQIPEQFEKGRIHLVPYYLVPKLELHNVDVFISVVALSETSEKMQNLVISKDFFGPDICYIMGQKNHPHFLNESNIVNNVKKRYPIIEYKPYNHYYGGCYEIMGIKNTK